MRLRIISCSVFLFIVALGFNIFFNLTSLDKLYIETIISQYRIVAKDMRRGIQRGLEYGKHLENFHNIEKILSDHREYIPNSAIDGTNPLGKLIADKRASDFEIFIAQSNGVIRYSKNSNSLMTRLPEPVMKDFRKREKVNKSALSADYTKYRF